MRTLIKTTIKDNNNIYVKETLETIQKFLDDKKSYVYLTRRRYNADKKILSERKCLIKKSNIIFISKET